VTNSAKHKGDRAELEVQGLLRDYLGVPARRQLGAGRLDDIGDIAGVPDTTIQVTNRADIGRAIREKLPETVEQQERAGSLFGALFCRRRGGGYVVVMTPVQFATLWREAQPVPYSFSCHIDESGGIAEEQTVTAIGRPSEARRLGAEAVDEHAETLRRLAEGPP
jgi:hypothetical protein